jgi:LysM repeat protein
MKPFHIVQAPDETLVQISKIYGVGLDVLRNINAIRNENKLQVGQKIYLRKEDVLGLHALFLDTDRNPIGDQKYFLEFNGRVIQGVTGPDGRTKRIFTEQPSDEVRILIARLDGSPKHVTTVASGFRNKLVTILSPRYRADAKTELDPASGANEAPQATVERKPIYQPGQRQPATTDKDELGPQVASTTTADKRPLVKVTGDIPDLDLFLDKFDGRQLCDADIKDAAARLKCEPGVIHAIAKQESSTSSFFQIGARSVPKILYERHLFRNFTKRKGESSSPYTTKYPDICGEAYHRTRRDNKKHLIDQVTKKLALPDDIYGPGGVSQYKRLLKAYQICPDAALRACSWGKFQILGNSFKAAGFATVREFVRAMSRNEVEHLEAFLKFAETKALLLAGLRQREFEMIAAGHNGKAWRTTNPHYAENLEKFYKEYINGQANA